MLKVENKEIVISKTIVVGSKETVTILDPALNGFGVELFADPGLEDAEEKFKLEGRGSYAHVSFPFVEDNGMSFETDDLATTTEGKYSLRAAAQRMGIHMLVHVDIYFQRSSS